MSNPSEMEDKAAGTDDNGRKRRSLVLPYLVPVIIFAVIAVFFRIGLELEPTYVETPLLGKTAPAFSLPDLADPEQSVGSGDIAGRYALLNVWATWCSGCRQEHEFLVTLAASGFPIYGLNWKDDRAMAIQWLRTLGDPYVRSAFDTEGDVAIDYGVYGAPETFLLAPDLTIIAKHLGPLTPEIWSEQFLPAIKAHSEQS